MTIDDLGAPNPGTAPAPPSEGRRLSDLLDVAVHKTLTHHWAEIRLPAANRASAALLVATHIARERCGGAPQYFGAWLARHGVGSPHLPELRDCLVAMVASESIGTPDGPANDEHLEGFVAEHIWHLLTIEDALTIGAPVRVDGPDWSVTDSGGDGLVIYRPDGTLIFRLWETKAHTGDGAVRDVVNGACRQLDSKALRYLARFSKVGQGLNDPDLRTFYGRLLELWRAASREAGGGVSVTTAADVIDNCFGNYPNYWAFTHDDQRQGLVVAIENYAAFAKQVRKELWNGL
ncbi:MAG: hypothetical protein GEU94_03320 [Micromonosporaceae bacterium]|nr:hypothetical protein [Micromonosporaceae bacterium]